MEDKIENCLRCGDQLDNEIVLCNNCCAIAIDTLAEKENYAEWSVEYGKLSEEE